MKLIGQWTPQGKALLARSLLGGALTVTRVVAGSGFTPQDADSLAEPRQTAAISARTADGSLATLLVTLAASLAESTYSLAEMGVYAQDPDAGEILYQIYRLDQPLEIEPTSRLVLRSYLRLAASDQLELTLALPPSGLLIEADVENKADLVNEQVPYSQTPHLTEVRTLYVDAAAGNDSNPGTQSAPFQTIQAAMNSLPKDLGTGRAVIYVAAGTYDEDVVIEGFFGGTFNDTIALKGSDSADETRRLRSLRISNNGTCVHVSGVCMTENASGYTCLVSGARAKLAFCNIKKNDASQAHTGVGIGGWAGAQVFMNSCVVDGYTNGIMVLDGSVLAFNGCTVKNCGIGLKCGDSTMGSSGIVLKNAASYSGNSANETTSNGGQIFET